MAEVRLSSKNQIVVPRDAREALGVEAGSQILVVVRNGSVSLLPKPADYAKAIRGMADRPWPKDHLAKERRSWAKRRVQSKGS